MFDVDGTLTPSRGRMNKDFSLWFGSFCHEHSVYLVTGSDRPKTIEQIGEYLYSKCESVYQCSGNDHWKGDTNIRSNDWVLPDLARRFLEKCLVDSDFSIRTGNHIEQRSGMVNFSVVGRNANLEERAAYVRSEEQVSEREYIAKKFNDAFSDLEATVGGDTGIDISARGMSKKQVLTDFDKDAIIHFYGDKTFPGGNDHEIAMEVRARGNEAVQVDDWRHTWKLLKEKCKE